MDPNLRCTSTVGGPGRQAGDVTVVYNPIFISLTLLPDRNRRSSLVCLTQREQYEMSPIRSLQQI